jgi:hypothetical protein
MNQNDYAPTPTREEIISGIDGSWEYVAPAGYKRTSRLDRKTVRA